MVKIMTIQMRRLLILPKFFFFKDSKLEDKEQQVVNKYNPNDYICPVMTALFGLLSVLLIIQITFYFIVSGKAEKFQMKKVCSYEKFNNNVMFIV